MSTATENAPVTPQPNDAAAETGSGSELKNPLLWLAVILVLAVGIRWWYGFSNPLQQDEFDALFAVAERTGATPGFTPSVDNPLTPRASLQEVQAHSVMPYGIDNPVPVYNYLLWFVAQAAGITEVTLRLPSLLAGLGCVAGVYWLGRRFLSAEVGLVAAALAAVEPLQITTSHLARPYALANLAVVLSFIALTYLLYDRRKGILVAAAVGYAASVAALGNLNPVLLMAVVAQVGLVIYWAASKAPLSYAPEDPLGARPAEKPEEAPGGRGLRLGCWLAALAVAGVACLPQLEYYFAIRALTESRHDYFVRWTSPSPRYTLFVHVISFLVPILVLSVAGFIIREVSGSSGEEGGEGDNPEGAAAAEGDAAPGATAIQTPEAMQQAAAAEQAAPGPLPRESDYLVWLGRLWMFLPLLVSYLLANFLGSVDFMTRNLTYATLGWVLVLAYWATRDRSRDVRLGVVAATVLAMFFWGFLDVSRGDRTLHTDLMAQRAVADLDQLTADGRFLEKDVLLFRPSTLEGDLLPDLVPEKNRAAVRAALMAPVTTLYAPKTPKPYVLLSHSHYRGKNLRSLAGTEYKEWMAGFYNDELARQLRPYERYWIRSNVDRNLFLASFLPWLADAVGHDLRMARANRPEAERYFIVPAGVQPDDYVPGLSDSRSTDFNQLMNARKLRPEKGSYAGLGVAGALGAATLPGSLAAAPTWLMTHAPAPRAEAPLMNEAVANR